MNAAAPKKKKELQTTSLGNTQAFEDLIASIKSKEELSTLDDDFIAEKIEKIFAADHTIKRKFEESKDFKQFSKSKVYEDLLKRIRKELRVIYGVFQQSKETFRKGLLVKLRSASSDDERRAIITEILGTHQSTKERLPHYQDIYSRICEEIKPTTVVDLGCGMNPLAYHYFIEHGLKPRIIASDISQNDMRFLEDAFIALKIDGKTIALDLTKEEDILQLATLTKDADVTFLLKLLDSLEEAKRHISYKIFDNIESRWIVASFPTKSLGGKKTIARAGRSWFERLLARKELKYSTFSVENELFYTIKR